MARKPTVGIVGAGRVGGAIAIALARAGYEVVAVSSRSRSGRQRAHNLLDVPVLEPHEVAAAGDLVFVAVPDDAIDEMARTIATGVRKSTIVAHTSGGTSVDALSAVKDAGGRIASVHPLQTIPSAKDGADALAGAAVAITCDESDRPALMRVARAWGGRPFALPDDAKRIYHAAAVFASNYVVSSVWAATVLFENVGIHNARGLLAPLVRTSIDNVISRGGAKAITGPVSRGDAELIRHHIAALKDADATDGAITESYRALARMTAALSGSDVELVTKATR